MSRGRYRRVLREPGVAWLLGTSLVARLPVAMVNLAIILRVAGATGSYARAGAVTSAFVVGTAVVGPLLGRLADAIGRRPVLLGAATINAAGLVALALIPVRDTAPVLLVAALAGASLPPVAPAVRSLWPSLARGEERSALYAIDATMQEVTFMVGPSLVAILSALSGAQAALIACAAIGLGGTLAVALHPAVARPASVRVDLELATVTPGAPSGADPPPLGEAPGGRRRHLRLAGIPGLAPLVLIVFMFLASALVVEVSVVAFAGHAGVSHQSGLLLAVWSLGSLIGGLLFGARMAHAGSPVLAPLIASAALGFACLALAPSVGVLYPLLLVAGLSIAPGFSCMYGLVGSLAPSRSSVEAFSWVSSGLQLGIACGAALGGVLVDTIGTRWSFLFAAGGAGLTALFTWWRFRSRVTRAPC